MFEIGSSLRQARQHRGLAVADVERQTHIRAKYLDALEEERFDVLPGQAYVRGFLRTYAEALGLDGNLYVDEFNARFATLEEEPIQHAAMTERRELRGVRRGVGVVVALAAAIVVVWQLGFSSAQRTPSATPPAVSPAATRTPTATKPRPTRRPSAAPARPAGPATLVVRATRGDCWVAVHLGSATGPLVYQRTLAQGGTLRFGLGKPLWVRLGAPWNADVAVRGKALAAFPHQPVDFQAA